ncbi:Mu transposase, C-terminal [Paenibacillus sophorae]|uniref:Mu transposase C-terminal domain-containing protein n=1 Tax=Paenibacillus sophorae TaxID=1333845 RepID=A0A1H8VWX1_9BACL|nr:Mu transposase C-terminal domain-containing protein [Paenibacillus sophorae]QWU15618.1 Mu transposase C-terminal domain-containing protein [Paenibacillus sophorae]SEP19835.1 Mu transposase, C-terminal [Paenibacillus sophorae]
MNVFINNVFKREKEGKPLECERVLWIHTEKDTVITISIINDKALPQYKTLSSLKNELESGQLIKLQYDPYAKFMVPEDKLRKNEIKIRDQAWVCIKDIVELEPNIYDSKERYQIIKEVCKRTGKGKKFIYKYLRYYWMGGKKENALLPRFRKCGGPGKSKNPKGKMGRPRITATVDPELSGVLVNSEIRHIFDEYIRDVYLKVDRRDSVRFTYVEMLKGRFGVETKIVRGAEVPVILPDHKIPSIAQLRYHIRTRYTRQKRLMSREGKVAFDRDFRPLLGSETRRATGPGQIFEIDATIADVYLVSSDDVNQIIGRPVVYIVVDVFTHIVTGLYVGLEGPSWLGAMMAIENTVVNKVEFCAEYGIEITEDEWPCHHMPQHFYADRGEMESKNADSLGRALGIKLKNAPPYRADLKGIVEQQFRTLNLTLQPWMPGAVKKEYQKRGGPDYVLDAKLTLKDFTKMVIELILHRNNYHYMEHYPLDKAMSKDHVKPIARDLWNWGIQRDHFLHEVHPDIVRLNVLPEDEVTVSSEGIKFEGMYYWCNELVDQGWFVQGKSTKTVIAYDRRNMNHVYIKLHDGKGFIKCYLLEKSSRFQNLSLEEVKMKRFEEKLQKSLYQTTRNQQDVELSTRLELIKKQAEERVNDERDHALTKTERKAEIRANRIEERNKLRKIQSFELNKSENKNNNDVITIEDTDDSEGSFSPRSKLEFLSKIRKEG